MKKIKYNVTFFLCSFAVLFSFFSCEVQDSFEYDYAEDNSKLNMSAWAYIQKNDSLSYLEEAILQCKDESLYERTEKATFILPTNRAFKVYLEENNYDTIGTVPISVLKDILRYHIVKAEVNFNNPALAPKNKPIAYKTENGQIMYLSHTGTYVGLINEGTNKQWQIRTSNLVPDNGIIHIVDHIVFYSDMAK
ncbi:fasciclin domain-containing protein [Sphingobacterium faecium]|uniref:fasciclin domain-containing protein n=1 Tax=Sphingobacterium faecium TaxID=34087 RepID=UPI001D16FE4C|nr:fasciclin domain-containing protein [Sphingobacterium faecium]